MNSTLNLIFIPALLSFVVSALSTPLVIKLYRRFGWVDDPAKNPHPKVVHKKPIPRGGGIPIFLSLLLVGSLLFGLDKHFIGITLGALVLTIVGILDDIFDLNPYLRLATGLIAALTVVGFGIGIAYVTNPLAAGQVINLNQPQIALFLFGKTRTIWILADIFALIWILWTMNIVNWSKGVDGQMPGFVAIAALVIGLLSLQFSADITQWQVSKLAALTAGAFAGFLIWNNYPQKIMPGYGGGSLAGYLLAVLSILSGAKVATLILILSIPMLDALYTIVRRVMRGKSPVWGDRGHLHHRLLDMGWSKLQIAIFYWAVTALLGVITLHLNSTQKLFTIVSNALILGGVLLWLKFFRHINKEDS